MNYQKDTKPCLKNSQHLKTARGTPQKEINPLGIRVLWKSFLLNCAGHYNVVLVLFLIPQTLEHKGTINCTTRFK